MSKLLLSILWVGTLAAAFFVGRLTMESASEQSADRDSGTPKTRSVLDVREKTPSTSEKDDPAAEMASAKPSIESLIAAVRVQMQGNAMSFMNPSAMMKLMAPLADLSPGEIKQALAEVERTITAPQQKMMLYSVLLGRLAETDGPGALAYAEEHLDSMGPMGQGARMSAMSTWAQNDPDAAWEYFQNHRDDDESSGPWGGNRMMLAPLFSAMASHDIEDAFQRLQSLDDSERMMAINGLVQGAAWDEDRRQVLLDEVAGMDAETKQQIHQQIISQWAMMDTEGALEWAASLPEDERGNLIQAAAGPLMMTDPERGAEVLLEHAAPEEKPGVYANIVSQWASRDPNAAGEWLGNLPQGPELDQARARFSSAVASRDPQSAMAWAMTVENPDNRLQAIGNAYRQWSRTDPEGANQALEEAGLTDEQLQAITPTEAPGPIDIAPQPN